MLFRSLITAEMVEAQIAAARPAAGTVAETREARSLSEIVETHLAGYFAGFGRDLPPAGLYDRVLAEIERPLLIAALTATRGNQIKAADLLGLNRNTLRKKVRDLDIQVFRGAVG